MMIRITTLTSSSCMSRSLRFDLETPAFLLLERSVRVRRDLDSLLVVAFVVLLLRIMKEDRFGAGMMRTNETI